jgi:hypothetical protein
VRHDLEQPGCNVSLKTERIGIVQEILAYGAVVYPASREAHHQQGLTAAAHVSLFHDIHVCYLA